MKHLKNICTATIVIMAIVFSFDALGQNTKMKMNSSSMQQLSFVQTCANCGRTTLHGHGM